MRCQLFSLSLHFLQPVCLEVYVILGLTKTRVSMRQMHACLSMLITYQQQHVELSPLTSAMMCIMGAEAACMLAGQTTEVPDQQHRGRHIIQHTWWALHSSFP